MNIAELKPYSPNWNQLKHEFTRNLSLFETLRNATKDKAIIKLLDSIIENNKKCSDAMDIIEKSPDVFQEPPFVEPDEAIEE